MPVMFGERAIEFEAVHGPGIPHWSIPKAASQHLLSQLCWSTSKNPLCILHLTMMGKKLLSGSICLSNSIIEIIESYREWKQIVWGALECGLVTDYRLSCILTGRWEIGHHLYLCHIRKQRGFYDVDHAVLFWGLTLFLTASGYCNSNHRLFPRLPIYAVCEPHT